MVERDTPEEKEVTLTLEVGSESEYSVHISSLNHETDQICWAW